jgi:hypothetical protein
MINDQDTKCWREPGGRAIAKGRALRALRQGKQINDTVWCLSRRIRREEALAMIIRCDARAILSLAHHGDWTLLARTMQPTLEGQHHDNS